MAINRFDKDEELRSRDFSYSAMAKRYLLPHIGRFALVIGIMFVVALLELLPAYFISVVLDICAPQKNYKLIILLGVSLFIANIIILYCTKYRAIFANETAMQIIKNVRSDLFAHMQRLPFAFFDSRPHGKILVRIVNYVNTISGLLSNGILDMIMNIFKLLATIGFMFALNVKFTLICLAGIPIFVVFITFMKRGHDKAWQKYSAKQSNMNAYIQESISGMKITQSFAREEKNGEIFDGLCDDTKKYWMKAVGIANMNPRFVEILSTLILVLVYYIGANAVGGGVMKVGAVIAFASCVSRFWSPIQSITAVYNNIINCVAYIERIFEMMHEPLVVEDLPGAVDIGEIKGDVSYKNVTFAYDVNSPNIFENVSFDVKSGESIALVGPTGAGKSTIINLLARFYNIQDGEITIDGKNVYDVTLKSLRSQIGIMLQDSILFSGTIADNIRYGKLDATDEEIEKAAEAVCAHDFIKELPDGYNTQVTEGGASLSAGQKQLISFARTLLADPKILILDEATSSIDTETELILQRALERLLKGRTSFIIAHRLSTIKNSSRIMYIADKGIAESGTHEELIKLGGRYAELYAAQYKFLEQL